MKFSAPAISATVTFWKDTHDFFLFFSPSPLRQRHYLRQLFPRLLIYRASCFSYLGGRFTRILWKPAASFSVVSSFPDSSLSCLSLCVVLVSSCESGTFFELPRACHPPSSSPSPCLVSSHSAFSLSLFSLPLSVPFLISPASPLDLSPCQPISPPVAWFYLASVLFLVSPLVFTDSFTSPSVSLRPPLSIHPRFTFLSGCCPRRPLVQHLPLERHCVRESLWQSACEDSRDILKLKSSTLGVCPACCGIVAKLVLFWSVCLVLLGVCLS